MNSRIPMLAGLVVVQLIVVALFYLGGETTEDSTWLTVNTDEVTQVQISDGDATISVQRSDAGWQIEDYVADEAKIVEVLDKLGAMQAAWPVATTSDTQQRFEVAEDNFQRRLVLMAGESTLVDMYLGTSPGYQRVHARLSASDDIYSINLSNYELPINIDGWLDKAQLAVQETLTSVVVVPSSGETHSLNSSDEGWLYNGAAANQDEAATYANRFKSLRVLNIADADEWQQAETQAEISIEWEGGAKTLTIAKLDEEYLISVGQQYFKVATYIAEQLLLNDIELAAASAELEDLTSEPEQES